MNAEVVVVLSEEDPVAQLVAELWGTLPATGEHLDGVSFRRLGPSTVVVGRHGFHIHDENLDRRLPTGLRENHPTLVFPSIHRSERNIPCLTVHPLGNPGPTSVVGGRPRTLVPTDPPRMVSALRRLAESGERAGLAATFEATHHGPELGLPAFFMEIGYGDLPTPPSAAVRILADALRELEPSRGDRTALAVGGGHYAPHFRDLALSRRWAFGHILSRHALGVLDQPTVRAAFAGTPAAEGVVYASAGDATHPVTDGLGPRLRDPESPKRESGIGPTTNGNQAPSGT